MRNSGIEKLLVVVGLLLSCSSHAEKMSSDVKNFDLNSRKGGVDYSTTGRAKVTGDYQKKLSDVSSKRVIGPVQGPRSLVDLTQQNKVQRTQKLMQMGELGNQPKNSAAQFSITDPISRTGAPRAAETDSAKTRMDRMVGDAIRAAEEQDHSRTRTKSAVEAQKPSETSRKSVAQTEEGSSSKLAIDDAMKRNADASKQERVGKGLDFVEKSIKDALEASGFEKLPPAQKEDLAFAIRSKLQEAKSPQDAEKMVSDIQKILAEAQKNRAVFGSDAELVAFVRNSLAFNGTTIARIILSELKGAAKQGALNLNKTYGEAYYKALAQGHSKDTARNEARKAIVELGKKNKVSEDEVKHVCKRCFKGACAVGMGA